jgi:hypothetical protein
MSLNLPPIPNLEMAQVLYNKAHLPEVSWETNITPRFQTIAGTKSELQNAQAQAQVWNTLIHDPTQLRRMPRRWRVAAFSNPLEYSALAMGMVMRYAIVHQMSVMCCSLEELANVNKYQERYEIVFVHDVFDDMEPADYKPLRAAHSKNFHLFYSMTGTLETAIEKIKLSPDYAFHIQQAAMVRSARTI